MNVIGISAAEQENIIATIAAILHLGNLPFSEGNKGHAVPGIK